jgi:hypothetical protein
MNCFLDKNNTCYLCMNLENCIKFGDNLFGNKQGPDFDDLKIFKKLPKKSRKIT